MLRCILLLILTSLASSAVDLEYQPPPLENPLRGLVPYQQSAHRDAFPHSMEFRYFGLGEFIRDDDTYDWQALEHALQLAQSRGKQLIFRIYCDYPRKPSSVPPHWRIPSAKIDEIHTITDYDSPTFLSGVEKFIHALGKTYDGDSRIAFITMGIVGFWGEWHTYPRPDRFASRASQKRIMQAFDRAFPETHVLMRYPAEKNDPRYAGNASSRFGYHDDSFAYSTLDNPDDSKAWHFLPMLEAAGVSEKWKHAPIGGEIRPELWTHIFTDAPHEKQQDFVRCVRETHASWLMDSSMFRENLPLERITRAKSETHHLGYDIFISSYRKVDGGTEITIENRGVAPFSYDWPVYLESRGQRVRTDILLSQFLPGEPLTILLRHTLDYPVLISVPNPMHGGHPLIFSNKGAGGKGLPLP